MTLNKITLFVGFFSLALSFAARGDDNPETFCSSTNSGCSQPMQDITKKYSQAGVAFLHSNLDGFSGACYHFDPSYDPNYTHYGAFVFATENKVSSVGGLFLFFYPQDPYIGMTSAEMKKKLLDSGVNFKAVAVNATSLELIYAADTSDTRYWFRGDDRAVYVIGRQASSGSEATMVFCEMTRH